MTTVGWNNANPAVITLDLGKAQPIRRVSFRTAAGVADSVRAEILETMGSLE